MVSCHWKLFDWSLALVLAVVCISRVSLFANLLLRRFCFLGASRLYVSGFGMAGLVRLTLASSSSFLSVRSMVFPGPLIWNGFITFSRSQDVLPPWEQPLLLVSSVVFREHSRFLV